MPTLARSSFTLAVAAALLCGCSGSQQVKKEDLQNSGQGFDQIIEAYAGLYDREMTTATGNDKGMRVVPARGFLLPIGSFTPETRIEDLAVECHATPSQIRQYPLREYPPMQAVNKTDASLSLPTTLSKAIGVVASAGGGTATQYQVRFESPTALVLPLTEVNKLWSKPGCAAKVFKRNTSVVLVSGYVFARLNANFKSEQSISPSVQVLNQDVFSLHSTGANSWEASDREKKRYMRIGQVVKFGDTMPKAFGEEGVLSRDGEQLPPLSRPSDETAQTLIGNSGRYGGDE